jgi:hypothetical protein
MTPYEEGDEAYYNGNDFYDDNPYIPGTEVAEDWENGFRDALENDEHYNREDY